MKKNIFYILIIFTLIGILSPISQVSAQIPDAAKGQDCVLMSDNGTFTNSFRCEQPPGGAIGKTCYIVGSAPAGTSNRITFTCQYSPNTILGTCTYPNTPPTTNIASYNCQSPGVFTVPVSPTPTPTRNPSYDPSATKADYTLLAPLGEVTTVPVSDDNALGSYLNKIITLLIGMAAVLAMVMIVMGGIEYMTSELISSKEAGKQRINNAIFGLLIALSAWLILNTINPDLLNTNINIAKTTIEYAEDPIPFDSGNPPGVTSGCTAGIQKTSINMFACGDILQKVNSMLAASKAAGLNLTGGGYRSMEQQRQLRIKNCKGDTTNPNAVCKPPTAVPGQSNHNNGKAFDLQCDGVFIQTRDNKCFLWLQANAANYGLYNFAPEPWHWSVNGG
jgi:type IV secretory pathway VirB2 component (pilin)